LVALVLAVGATAVQAGDRRKTPTVEAVRKVKPCVVSITSEKKAASSSRWPFTYEENQKPRVSGMGTGVLIDPRGYILTNQHVVDKVQGIEIHLADGTALPARVVQQDEAMDIAVLKVEAGRVLPAVVVGSSADLEEGEEVIAIGNAFGYENTISVGIVSALGRNVTLSDEQVYRNLIQTDACINPGNSGGPLVNIEGELIGINVAVRAGAQGIGFALPIDDVKKIAVEMLSTRRLAGTWHGMITAEARTGSGRSVLVADVPTGSPAEAAGVLKGDQVVRVGDLFVNGVLDVERALIDVRPGVKNEVVVRRGGQEKVLALELQPLPRSGSDAGDRIWRALGLRAVAVNRDYVKAVAPERSGGLWVQAVQPGSPAARSAIQKGDILIGMSFGSEGWQTTQLDNVLYVLQRPEMSRSQPLQCWLIRRNELLQKVLPASEAPYLNARR
jgi:serine protease Do